MTGRAIRSLLVAVTTTTLALPMATAALPSLELDVVLDPDTRRLDVTATLRADAGEADLQWQLTPAAGLEPGLLRLAASPHRRTRAIRYTLSLDASAPRSHRDTLTGTDATAGPLGSFLPAISGWHPVPADGAAFTYRVTVSVPATQRALVPGTLDLERMDQGRYVAGFAFDHPAQGIDLMAGPYAIEERILEQPAGVRLRTYFHPELQSLSRDYLDAAAQYLARYQRDIGDYPYTTFSIVSSPTPTGFGMPTLTYLGIDVLKLPFIRHTSLGHEVLHNWWGNGVFVDYGEGNWCEGLTTFMADYAYKEQDSPEAARQMRLAWLRDLAALPPDPGNSLRAFASRTHGASQVVGYHKAAMLFLMLRDILGEERFRQTLRAFWQQHRFSAASWLDLQRGFEHTHGASLSRLFNETLDRTQLPAPVIAHAAMRSANSLTLTLRQEAPPAALRVPVRALGAFGSTDFTLELTETEQTFTVAVPGRAAGVVLDPDLRLLRRLAPAELPPILRQVMLAPRVALQLPDADATLHGSAQALAAALLDNTSVESEASAQLLIGTHAAIDLALPRLGLSRPDRLRERGSAQAWAATSATGQPVMVVSVRDAAALQALARPLPHYGGQGYVVFDGGKASERGPWPADTPVIEVR